MRMRWQKTASIVALTVAMAASTALSADWCQWRGPKRDNKSTETGLLKKWPAGGPKLIWSIDGLGEGMSTVSICILVIGDASVKAAVLVVAVVVAGHVAFGLGAGRAHLVGVSVAVAVQVAIKRTAAVNAAGAGRCAVVAIVPSGTTLVRGKKAVPILVAAAARVGPFVVANLEAHAIKPRRARLILISRGQPGV